MFADVPDIALSTLAAFVESGISSLTVYQEWPYANEQLTYPTLTISTVKPKRMPHMPYQIVLTSPDTDGKVIANEVVANWDFQMQLDLWCSDKAMRKDYTDRIIALFNSQEMDASGLNKPDGLSLQMTAHFNEWVRYEIDTTECIDDEAGAQRQERREKIMVLVNCREVRQRTYYAMKNIDVHIQAPTDPVVSGDTGTEVIEVIP